MGDNDDEGRYFDRQNEPAKLRVRIENLEKQVTKLKAANKAKNKLIARLKAGKKKLKKEKGK